MKTRLSILAIFLLVLIVLNVLPGRVRRQTADENAQVANGVSCTVQDWGWPATLYSRYGGGGYVSPMQLLVTEATPIFSQWHTFGLIFDIALALGGALLILWIRLPGLMGEGQENIPIIRDSEREDDRDE